MRPLPEIVADLKARLHRAGFAAIIAISEVTVSLVFWPSGDEKDPSQGKDPLAELERLASQGALPIAFLIAENVCGAQKFEFVVLKEFESERRIRDFLRSFSEGYQARLRKAGLSLLNPLLN